MSQEIGNGRSSALLIVFFRPWKYQSLPFVLLYVLDQIIQIDVFRRTVCLRLNYKSKYNWLWGMMRSFVLLVLSGIMVTMSTLFPAMQTMFAVVSGNLEYAVPKSNGPQLLIDLVAAIPTGFIFTSIHSHLRHHPSEGYDGNATDGAESRIVQIDGRYFKFDNRQCLYMLESPRDQSSLLTLRQGIPWPTRTERDYCTSEEFHLLCPEWPEDHVYFQGTPALSDTFRDILRNELEEGLLDFAHGACAGCTDGQCPKLFRLICMLLLGNVASQVCVRLDKQGQVSGHGTAISHLRLRSLGLQRQSKVVLKWTANAPASNHPGDTEIAWADLLDINSAGVLLAAPSAASELLPLWVGRGVQQAVSQPRTVKGSRKM